MRGEAYIYAAFNLPRSSQEEVEEKRENTLGQKIRLQAQRLWEKLFPSRTSFSAPVEPSVVLRSESMLFMVCLILSQTRPRTSSTVSILIALDISFARIYALDTGSATRLMARNYTSETTQHSLPPIRVPLLLLLPVPRSQMQPPQDTFQRQTRRDEISTHRRGKADCTTMGSPRRPLPRVISSKWL